MTLTRTQDVCYRFYNTDLTCIIVSVLYVFYKAHRMCVKARSITLDILKNKAHSRSLLKKMGLF